MLAPRTVLLSALAATALACQAVAGPIRLAPESDGPGATLLTSGDPFPAAKSAILVRVGTEGNDTLAELVAALGATSGVSFSMTEQTRSMLASTRTGISADVDVPADRAWAWIRELAD